MLLDFGNLCIIFLITVYLIVRVLDDPLVVHHNLCGAGGGGSMASDGGLPSSLSHGNGCEKDLQRGIQEEPGLCSSPKKTLDKEIYPRGSTASSPGGDALFSKRNSRAENGYSGGAISKNIVEQNGCGTGRGAIPKGSTSNVAPSSNLVGYDGSRKASFWLGNCLGPAPKGSLLTENDCARGRSAALQIDEENLAIENGPTRGKGVTQQRDNEKNCAMENDLSRGRGVTLESDKENLAMKNGLGRGRGVALHSDAEGNLAVDKTVGRGRASILQLHVEGGPGIENSPSRGRGATLQKDMELEASRRNPSEILPLNHCKTEVMPEEVQLPKPTTTKEVVSSGTIASTSTECLSNDGATPSANKDATSASSEDSLIKNVADSRLNFASLLEKGKVYNGIITLVDSYKNFTAAVVVDGTEFIFSDADETFSAAPFRDDFKPEVGSLVGAFSSTEETWYRAQVLEADHPKYKVCFIDFGNKEEVQKVKPIPEGLFSELPELAFSARFYSGLIKEYEVQLKKMVQVDCPIKFRVAAKKQFSVKVILYDDVDNDTAVAEYIFDHLLPHSSTEASETKAIPPETKAIPSAMKAISLEEKAISSEPKVSSQETKTSQEIMSISETMAIFKKTKAIFPEKTLSLESEASSPETMASFPKTKAIFPESKSFQEAMTVSSDATTTSPDMKIGVTCPVPLMAVIEGDSPQEAGAPTTGQQGSTELGNDKEEQVIAVHGALTVKKAASAHKGKHEEHLHCSDFFVFKMGKYTVDMLDC